MKVPPLLIMSLSVAWNSTMPQIRGKRNIMLQIKRRPLRAAGQMLPDTSLQRAIDGRPTSSKHAQIPRQQHLVCQCESPSEAGIALDRDFLSVRGTQQNKASKPIDGSTGEVLS